MSARKVAALRSTDVLLVEVEGNVIGLLDLARVGAESDTEPVSQHMTGLTFAVSPGASVRRTHDWLVARGTTWVPVVVGLFVVGTVCRAALEHALREPFPTPFVRAAA